MRVPVPCHRGAGFTLDGRPIAIRPQGSVGRLLGGKNLPFASCSGKPIQLQAGAHTLFAEGGLQPDSITLSSRGSQPAPATASPPATTVTAAGSGYDVAVRGATAPFFLSIGQNRAPGWTAMVGGRGLGAPMVLDGYSAGWLVDRAGSFTITVRYGPQRAYTAALLVSAVAFIMTLVVIVLSLIRARRSLT